MVTQKQIRDTAGRQIIFIISAPVSSLPNTLAIYTYNPKYDIVEYFETNGEGIESNDEYDVPTATKYINELLKRNDAVNASHNFEKPKTLKGHNKHIYSKKCPIEINFKKMI